MDRSTHRPRRRPSTLVLAVALTIPLASTTPTLARLDDDQSYRTATGLLNRGLHDLAAQQYREFLKNNPDNPKAPAARYALAVCLARLGQHDQAAKELDQLSNLDDFEFAPDVKLLRGQCSIAAGDFEAAARCLHDLAADHPDYAQAAPAAALEGEAWYRAGKPDQAARTLASINPAKLDAATRDRCDLFHALADAAQGNDEPAADRLADLRERSPQSPFIAQATLTEAQCRHRLSDVKAALPLYKLAAASKDPAVEPLALLGLAQLTRAEGNAVQAGRTLDDLLSRYADTPGADAARLERGRAYLDENKPEQALSALKPLADAKHSPLAPEASYWTAKAELALSRFDAAADRLGRAIDASPKSDLLPNLIYDRAVALSLAGDSAEALDLFGQFRENFPKHELATEAALAQASLLHTAGRYDDSASLCRAFLKAFPRHPKASTAALLLAENNYLAGRFDDAAEQYSAFIEQYPRDAHVWRASVRRGLALANLGAGKDARAALEAAASEQAAGANTDPALQNAARLALGNIAFDQADWPAAQRWFTQVLAAEPDKNLDALLKLALSIHRQGKPADAVKLYDRLIAAAPDSDQALHATFERGQALAELNRADDARRDFEAVIAAEEKSDESNRRFTAHATRHLASIAMKQNKPEEAAKLLARIAGNPGTGDAAAVDLLYQQGLAYLAAADYAKAEQALQSFLASRSKQSGGAGTGAMPLSPVSSASAATARVHLAIAISRQSRYQDALDAITALEDDGADLDPALAQTLRYEKAWALKSLDKPADAAAAYHELLENPTTPDIETHASLDLAQLESSAGRHAEALALLDRLAKAASSLDESRRAALADQSDYLRGVCELRLERFSQAAATLGRFRDRSPESDLAPSAAALAGESLLRAGKPTEAIARLTQATTSTTNPEILGPALLRLGEACAAAERWTASEEALARYLQTFADSEMAFQATFGIGWAREHQSRYEAAIESYTDVVEHHKGPTAARAQFQIGECLYALKRHDDAVRELLKVDILYAYPEWSAAALFEAGRCLAEAGRKTEAQQQFQQVIDRFPDSDWAKPARERLAAAAPASLPGRSAPAVKPAKRASGS